MRDVRAAARHSKATVHHHARRLICREIVGYMRTHQVHLALGHKFNRCLNILRNELLSDLFNFLLQRFFLRFIKSSLVLNVGAYGRLSEAAYAVRAAPDLP